MKKERLVRLKEAISRTGLARSTIYKKISEGKFPQPFKNGVISVWLESEIDEYVEGVINARCS
ncbi:putative transcriptional regulator [Piscirickettsia salmonis]|uniref:helix-turn-helix transcriptional regulator n=1 Tax=Piscirickettsia salmonis TaxID=1238 RepID=UPI0012BB13B3|nr:AlpA family transcriptional regulator [Piscirickettsia salmonis]QGP53364.1 putative transcriptional regulator [Piscirickettsia salmonis]QGP60717.1 putative transcriptional regulator [Piscirickettsia salmonis]QGP62929.1 putative transcriptional regulator [Piscirickettsia salmonis]